MQDGKNKNMSTRYSTPPAPYAAGSKWRLSNSSRNRQSPLDAQRSYERYLALAQTEAQSGNSIEAENYYQHAEHYFRSTMSDRKTT